MKPTIEQLSQELSQIGIRPSHQRIKILEYLKLNLCHPTVDQIFRAIQPHLPTLSRTTVYNTMDEFSKAGLVRPISIEETEVRYDINVENHGHFKCDTCGMIRNFTINLDHLSLVELENCQVFDRNIYFKGTCPDCLGNMD